MKISKLIERLAWLMDGNGNLPVRTTSGDVINVTPAYDGSAFIVALPDGAEMLQARAQQQTEIVTRLAALRAIASTVDGIVDRRDREWITESGGPPADIADIIIEALEIQAKLQAEIAALEKKLQPNPLPPEWWPKTSEHTDPRAPPAPLPGY